MKLDMVGVIPLFFGYAVVMIYSGASYSFVSMSFVLAHNFNMEKGNQEWNVRVPKGET